MSLKTPESGSPITAADLSEMQGGVATPLNSALTEDNIGRASLGSDQLYKGAALLSRQYECRGGDKIIEHVTYPETIRGPHWGTTGSVATDNAAERERWQHIPSYSSSTILPAGTSLFEIRSKGEAFSIFFWLNARISSAWRYSVKDGAFARSPYINGCRGWTSVIYYLRIPGSEDGAGNEITFKWSPTHMLGAFANEWNQKEPTGTKYKNFEYVHAYQDVQFITQAVIDTLAEYRGFNSTTNKLILADTSYVAFGWEFVAAHDRFDETSVSPVSDSGNMGTVGEGNGQAFTISNGNVGFMALRYESSADATLGHG